MVSTHPPGFYFVWHLVDDGYHVSFQYKNPIHARKPLIKPTQPTEAEGYKCRVLIKWMRYAPWSSSKQVNQRMMLQSESLTGLQQVMEERSVQLFNQEERIHQRDDILTKVFKNKEGGSFYKATFLAPLPRSPPPAPENIIRLYSVRSCIGCRGYHPIRSRYKFNDTVVAVDPEIQEK